MDKMEMRTDIAMARLIIRKNGGRVPGRRPCTRQGCPYKHDVGTVGLYHNPNLRPTYPKFFEETRDWLLNVAVADALETVKA